MTKGTSPATLNSASVEENSTDGVSPLTKQMWRWKDRAEEKETTDDRVRDHEERM